MATALTSSSSIFKPYQSPSPNPNPPLVSFLSSRRPPPFLNLRCSATTGGGSGHVEYEYERGAMRPRPQEIPWQKDLANIVHLIGNVGAPVEIKHLATGKTVAWTRIGVKKSPTDTTWISLTFWDELAHVAFQHVEKGQQVYVSGRLVADVVSGEDEKKQVYYKVVVQKLNFIEKSLPTVPLYKAEGNLMSSGAKHGEYDSLSSGSPNELWQSFFANPLDWWDNRNNKRNPKYPDFKHKQTGEALWIDAKNSPPWVKSQLALLDSKLGSIEANGANHGVSFMSVNDFEPF